MTLGQTLKQLRKELGLSQEAIGAQGFVSTPGWIKIENGARSPSEKMIQNLVEWLVKDKYLKSSAATTLREKLMVLKYLGNRAAFVRQMARDRALANPELAELVTAASTRPRRPRSSKN